MKYSEEHIEKISELIKQKTKLAMRLNEDSTNGVGPHKVLIFLLDKYLKRNLYRTISIKFVGLNIQNPRETDITHKLENQYEDESSLISILNDQIKDFNNGTNTHKN